MRTVLATLVLIQSLLTSVDADDRPNILFCIADDASYPHFGAYGCEWVQTPAFDRVAREGILFRNAYTPNAKCAPSRSCILTGRNSWQLEQAANHICFFPAKFKVYTEVLADHGYFVGKTGKGWGPGVDKDADGKPRQMAGKPFDRRKTKPPAKAISGIDYAANFDDFLDAAPDKEPWCFWYGGFEPHRAYEYGVGASKGGKKITDVDHVPEFWPDNEVVRNDLLDYAYEIEYFDSHLGRMLKSLEDRGQLDNTIVVVTADNGMPFPRIKGQEYELSNHLPLAIMWPRGIKAAGRTVDDYISFIDFAPTWLEVAGVDSQQSGMHSSPGRSLTDIFASTKSGQVNPARDHVLIGKERHDIGRPHDQGYPVRGIVKNGWLYLKNFEPSRWPAGNPETGYLNTDGSPTKTEVLDRRADASTREFWQWNFGKRPIEELYHVASDMGCMKNLAQLVEASEQKAEMIRQLEAELREQGDPRILGKGDVFDRYIYSAEGTRGFYERFMQGENLKAGWVSPTDFEKTPLTDEGLPVSK
jgi:N-sulfoglucosamine sulfohydrolase